MNREEDNDRNSARAVVVGGSTGIGHGIAQGLILAGYTVDIVSRSEPKGLGPKARWHHCDLGDQAATSRTMQSLAAEPLDVFCFAAAYYGEARKKMAETTELEWARQVQVMMHGLWTGLHSCLPALLDAGDGLLISVSSEVVYNSGPDRSGYAAVKAAASALVQSVAQEYDAKDLRVVELLPSGMVDSPGIRSRRPSQFDYTGYMTPDKFGAIGYHLGTTKGRTDAGKVLAVAADGTWTEVTEGSMPTSQSGSR
ncbi:SDR family NAD(P)-dependent oxidoreductase [Pseudarthrobacter sp. O4]|uniref:SDR family NAD(P)-dependent oxidoreductase n=1 Tax=Pseudarthrobacter sp. O4 TaxID=3418417 RepID=UPI003CF7F78F